MSVPTRSGDPLYRGHMEVAQSREGALVPNLTIHPTGEVIYLVDNDLDPADVPPAQQHVSDKIQERPSDWMPQLLRSLTGAGLAKSAVETPAG